MELPTKRSEVESYDPDLMLIYARPKQGKSSFCAALDDNLIIDLEDGYRSLSVMKIQARSYNDLVEIRKLVVKKGIDDGCTKENHKKPYRFITIDNASRLEEYCLARAAELYRETPMGKNFGKIKENGILTDKIDPKADVRTLPNGAGYQYLRAAVMDSVRMFKPLCNTLILVAHVREKQINKDSEEMTEMSLDLNGKTGDIICGEADAIGYMFRRGNQTIMSFKGGDNIIREARPLHLRNREFVVIESDESGKLTINTKEIFPDDKKQ